MGHKDGGALFTAIAAGSFNSLAITSDRTIVAWDDNASGQSFPPSLSNVVAVAAGSGHMLALKNDGTLAAWGFNNFGQATVPAGLTGVVAIAARGDYSLALRRGFRLPRGSENRFNLHSPLQDGHSKSACVGQGHLRPDIVAPA